MTLPNHEVYALRYATVARRRGQNFITPVSYTHLTLPTKA